MSSRTTGDARHFMIVSPLPLDYTGGASSFGSAMAGRLAAEGHQMTVLTTDAHRPADFWTRPVSGETNYKPASSAHGVTTIRLRISYPFPAPYGFGLLRRAGLWLQHTEIPAAVQRPLLRGLARAMPPLRDLPAALARLAPEADLIHALDSSWDGLFVAAADAAHASHKPFVAMPLMHLGGDAVRAHFQMAHQVDAYRSADAVLALSQREVDEYVRLGVAAERVHLLAMGVEPPPAEHSGAGDDFRRAHGIAGPLVAFLGANTYDKGAFTLALAAAQLAAAGTPVTLVYAGPASQGLLEFLARQPANIRSALADRVHVLGLVDEPAKHQLLAASTLLALPSQVDTFGIVLLEAWSHGKPVIGARAGGIADLVREEVDGLLAPFGDVSALAAAIDRLVSDPDLAARLGEAGRERVLRDFTWDRTYQTLLGIYDAVAEGFRQ